ncbi:MAG TPA: ATP-grasp domain-containing protein [Candidatus Binatia bacterium]|jgi:predicted ATP-grasp superfamily ATP-dependent carboligase|nr:ATP-grasp domain-containing protein [Candidatus Binatia bacterium]
MTGKVLVLGQDDRSFLAVVRSLGRHDLEVHVGWCPPTVIARRSRYIHAAHALPPYSPSSTTWLDALRALCERERFDLVIPTSDPTVVPLQRHHHDLEHACRLYVLPDAAVEMAFDKSGCHALARSLGIPVPRQETVALPTTADAILERFCLPVVLKPRTSYRWDDLAERRPVRTATTAVDLERMLGEYAGQEHVVVEEYFAGIGGGVDVLARDGEVLMTFQHVRLHEGRSYRGAPYRRTVPVDPAIAEPAYALFRALRYTGVAMFEFLQNARGEWVMIDLNARFWAALPLTVAAGADFPWYLYQMLAHERRDFPQSYRRGLYGRSLTRDLLWLKEQLHTPGARAALAVEVARGAWRLLTRRERLDTLVLDDPMPGLVELSRIARRLARIATR